MIDSHAHIDAKAFDSDRQQMISRAWDSGIEAIIIPDIQVERRAGVKELAESDPRLYRGIGVHPHHVGEITDAHIDDIASQCNETRVVAIGEIGLDYYYDFCEPSVQQNFFRKQVALAKSKNLPIIVHNRESDDDVLQIISDEQDGSLTGVLHCFSSGIDVLKKALDLGMHVSFTGNITFKNSTLSDVVRYVPVDRFMIETDSPYITPVPHRGKRNEPQYVSFVAKTIAEIKNMTLDEITQVTTATAKKLFKLALALIALTTVAVAQPEFPNEDDYENDYEWDIAVENYFADSVAYERWIRPRKLGVGISLGTNTTVELQQYLQRFDPTFIDDKGRDDPSRWTEYSRGAGPETAFSFDGLFSFGATLTYGLSTNIVLEGTYLYTENTAPAEQFGLDPITTNIVEVTALYNANPYSKLNFWPQIGMTYSNTNDGDIVRNKIGINGGIGLGMNIPTTIGLFYPMFNVRFNFMLGTDEDRVIRKYIDPETGTTSFNRIDPTQESVDIADVNTIFSIPRFTILYYLPF